METDRLMATATATSGIRRCPNGKSGAVGLAVYVIANLCDDTLCRCLLCGHQEQGCAEACAQEVVKTFHERRR